jgi:hypothetical protein
VIQYRLDRLNTANAGSEAMADPNATTQTHSFEDDYSWWEVIYWLVGIIMIPLVPILMVAFLTPYSGVGATGH